MPSPPASSAQICSMACPKKSCISSMVRFRWVGWAGRKSSQGSTSFSPPKTPTTSMGPSSPSMEGWSYRGAPRGAGGSRGCSLVVEEDAGIHYAETLFVDDDRIQIHLGDLRVLHGHPGDCKEQIGEGLQIRGASSPNPLEHRGGLDLPDHGSRPPFRQKGKAETEG